VSSQAVHPIPTIPFRGWMRPKAAKIIDLLPTVPDPVDRSQLFPSVLFLQLSDFYSSSTSKNAVTAAATPTNTAADSTTKPNKTIAMLYTYGKAQRKYQVIGNMYS
jgi:hypothetical protein